MKRRGMKVGSGAEAFFYPLIVTTPDWAKRARNILYQTGAEDVASTGEAKADFATADKPVRRGGSDTGYDTGR